MVAAQHVGSIQTTVTGSDAKKVGMPIGLAGIPREIHHRHLADVEQRIFSRNGSVAVDAQGLGPDLVTRFCRVVGGHFATEHNLIGAALGHRQPITPKEERTRPKAERPGFHAFLAEIKANLMAFPPDAFAGFSRVFNDDISLGGGLSGFLAECHRLCADRAAHPVNHYPVLGRGRPCIRTQFNLTQTVPRFDADRRRIDGGNLRNPFLGQGRQRPGDPGASAGELHVADSVSRDPFPEQCANAVARWLMLTRIPHPEPCPLWGGICFWDGQFTRGTGPFLNAPLQSLPSVSPKLGLCGSQQPMACALFRSRRPSPSCPPCPPRRGRDS